MDHSQGRRSTGAKAGSAPAALEEREQGGQSAAYRHDSFKFLSTFVLLTESTSYPQEFITCHEMHLAGSICLWGITLKFKF